MFGEPLDADFNPHPALEHSRGGWVSAKAPVTIEMLSEMPVERIVKMLKDDWSPAKLRELDTGKDFLNPLNADGMGRLLKADIGGRLAAYIPYAPLLFDQRDSIHIIRTRFW